MSATQSERLGEATSKLLPLLDAAGHQDGRVIATLLLNRLRNPQAYVTLVGETSTGKSSLLNSLLGKPLLPAYARPTTATVVHVICRDGDVRFYAVYRDATQEELAPERFAALNESPPSDLLRLQLRAPSTRNDSAGMNLFDTPGYNSVLASHEEVLREFLPQSDVVIFVAGYRTGFGQADQDLLEVVRDATVDDSDVPVLLVVNRAPPGIGPEDRRVREILDNATDSLRRPPELLIVASSTAGLELTPGQAAPLPDARLLWSRVSAIVSSPERRAIVTKKLEGLLDGLIDEADGILARRAATLDADEATVRAIGEQIGVLKTARTRSLEAIERTHGRLTSQLPRLVESLASEMSARLKAEVMQSEKWLGQEECIGFLAGHAMPFEVRQSGRRIEEAIAIELDSLDRELTEIANTAVEQIVREAKIASEGAAAFASNVARTVTQRLAGAATSSALRGLGGVGGAAAGAGNLAKMIVKRIGNLFGKTFGREVYKVIGRIFTKRALQYINAAGAILIEVITFVWEANRWRGKVCERVEVAIAQWRKDVVADLEAQQLPPIRTANIAAVEDLYSGLIAEHEASLEARSQGATSSSQSISRVREDLKALHQSYKAKEAA